MTIRYSPVVRDALDHGHPVVALETGIITHALPRPLNLETALAVEEQLSAAGVVPATNPRFAAVIVINVPQGGKYYGGLVAAPVFHHVMEVSKFLISSILEPLLTLHEARTVEQEAMKPNNIRERLAMFFIFYFSPGILLLSTLIF